MLAGTEFVSKDGNNTLTRKALYGLKSSGAAFRYLLAENLDTMGYWTIYADPDL